MQNNIPFETKIQLYNEFFCETKRVFAPSYQMFYLFFKIYYLCASKIIINYAIYLIFEL